MNSWFEAALFLLILIISFGVLAVVYLPGPAVTWNQIQLDAEIALREGTVGDFNNHYRDTIVVVTGPIVSVEEDEFGSQVQIGLARFYCCSIIDKKAGDIVTMTGTIVALTDRYGIFINNGELCKD